MTSRAVLFVVLAVAPALSLGAQEAKSPPPPAALPQTQQPATPPPAAPAAPAAPVANASKPADPKPADPKPAANVKPPNALPVDEKTYVIGPEDQLAVSVWGQQELSCNCLVRPDGMITEQLIGDVKAEGLTLLELAKVITEGLSTKLNDPQVSVSLIGEHSKKYYIIGPVKAGGEKELIMPTTVLEALVAAGGFQDFADQKHIIVARGSKRFNFNYVDVRDGKHLEQNIYLESGDIIFVK